MSDDNNTNCNHRGLIIPFEVQAVAWAYNGHDIVKDFGRSASHANRFITRKAICTKCGAIFTFFDENNQPTFEVSEMDFTSNE